MDELARFGRFNLLKRIDSGTIADTYLARPLSDDEAGNELIIKRVHPDLTANEAFVELSSSFFRAFSGLHDIFSKCL